MSREKLKDFLATVPSTQDRITYTHKDVNGDGVVGYPDDLGMDPGTHEPLLDLDSPGGLLGDFLKFIVDDSSNAFKLRGGNVEAASTSRGDSIPAAEGQGSTSVFVKKTSTLGAALDQYSNSGKFDSTSATLAEIVKKTGPNDQSSHRLLSTIKGSDIDTTGATLAQTSMENGSQVTKSAHEILTQNNRFNPAPNGSAYAERDISDADFDAGAQGSGTSTIQREFGEFDPVGIQFALDSMKKIGSSLILKSAGWDGGVIPQASVDPDTIDLSINVKPTEQLRQVSADALRAKNAAGAPEIFAVGSARVGRGDVLGVAGADSFGTTYTDQTPFSSVNTSVIRAQAAAAILVLMEYVKEMMGTIDSLISSETGGQRGLKLTGRGPHFLGEADVSLSSRFDLLRRLVLTPTEFSYRDCVDVGLKIFFSNGAKISGTSDDSKISDYQHVQEAPGFWLAVARTMIRSANTVADQTSTTLNSTFDSGTISSFLLSLGQTKIIGFLNSAATIGDSMLKLTGGNKDLEAIAQVSGPRSVDSLRISPATRISKSREGKGSTSLSLAWRGNSLPAVYCLPKNVINASQQMGTLLDGTNPAKGMLASRLATKTYVDENAEGYLARIPNDIVRRLEDQLDAEYVPFYFHDLRTNEIISFHAFLGNLTDNYTPNYNSETGYGRVDPVHSYTNTSRKISLTFTIVATSKEDFDEMWWKINKLTTLVYPKWTKGTTVTPDGEASFTMPFSQVLAASPVIRLRVGDVIKGNYSRFNLSRLFGVGDSDLNIKVPDSDAQEGGLGIIDYASDAMSQVQSAAQKIFYAAFGSPLAYIDSPVARSLASQLLVNGFANPAAAAIALRAQTDPDSLSEYDASTASLASAVQAVANSITSANGGSLLGYRKSEIHFLRPTQGLGYEIFNPGISGAAVGTRYQIVRAVKVMITGRETVDVESKRNINKNYSFKGPKSDGEITKRTVYTVSVIDINAPAKLVGASFKVSHADMMPNYNFLFNAGPGVLLGAGTGANATALAQQAVSSVASAVGIPSDQVKLSMTDQSNFMDPENNAVVRSFESTQGRGLAGVIDSMNFNWLEGPWEIDWNSRAPKYCTVVVGFSPVHDITPGLDHSGYNRAPIYNVGNIMKHVAGDPYPDNGDGSSDSYHTAGAAAFRSENENDKN